MPPLAADVRCVELDVNWTCSRCRQPAREERVSLCVDIRCWADMHSFEVRCECGQRARFGIRGHQALREAINRGGSFPLQTLAGLGPEIH